MKHRRRVGSVLVAVAAGTLLVSCGESSDSNGSSAAPSSSSTSSPAPALSVGCAEVGALGAAAQALTEVEPLKDGLDALEDAVADTKEALATALEAGSAQLQPAVEQVQAAFVAVQSASDGVTAETLPEQAPAIVSALRGLKASLSQLSDALTQECPKP